ncbi:MAG: hypothetical protein ACOYON_15235 [Fimbriimonas sp.]
MFAVRNAPVLQGFATLTYTRPLTDDKLVKKHIAALGRKLRRLGIGFIWKLEFCSSGNPHLHLLMTEALGGDQLGLWWSRITGCHYSNHLVKAGVIRGHESCEWYMSKTLLNYSHIIPDGYRNMGRWWGVCGPGVAPVAIATIKGTSTSVARFVRVIKRIATHKTGQVPHDNGITSFHMYGVGGATLAKDVLRYALSMELNAEYNPLSEHRGI